MQKCICRILFCVIVFVSIVNSFASAQQNTLSLKVEWDKREFLLGEPIFVRCILENKSSEKMYIPYDPHGEQGAYFFIIVDSRGINMPRVIRKCDSIGPTSCLLGSGKQVVTTFNIYDKYGISKPDRYSISVKFESDGKYYEIEEDTGPVIKKSGWQGILEVNVGEINIVEPVEDIDKKALKSMMVSGDPDPRFLYWKVFYNEENRKKLMNDYPDSKYTAYARYFEAITLRYSNPFNQLPAKPLDKEFAQRALKYFEMIDISKQGIIFKENVAYYSAICHKYADSNSEKLSNTYANFKKEFPNSTYLQSLNEILGKQDMPTSQDSKKTIPDNGDKSKGTLGKNQGNTTKKKPSKNDSDSNTDGSANILFIIGGVVAGLLIIGLIIAIRSRKRSA